MNAFIGPKVGDYAARLEARLVAELPVATLLSGPAAGIIGGAWAAAPMQQI